MPNLNAQTPHAIRSSSSVRKMIVQRRDEARAADEPCWLCGQAIDWTLLDAKDTSNGGYPEMDHVLPVSTHPRFAADPANVKPSHKDCNGKRSNSMTAGGIGRASMDWEGLAD